MTDTSEQQFANWIPDTNRWNLPTPPPWALRALWEFDPMLVLIPSRKKVKQEEPAYLLCRRRQYSLGFSDVAMLDNKHPDTNMMYQHQVVPIAPLRFRRGKAGWTQQGVIDLITELKARDTWAISGGPDKDPDAVWKAVEYQEKLAEDKKRRELRQNFFYRGRDAWRSLQARIGSRNKTAHDGNRHANGSVRGERKIIVS